MTTQTLLAGLPAGVVTERPLPWEAALAVLLPLIEANEPSRHSAIPIFKEWIKDRDQPISIQQAEWLWSNFCGHFAVESPKRFTQWLHDPMSKSVKSPAAVGRILFQAWKAMHFKPWAERTRNQSNFGKVKVKAVIMLGYTAAFLLVFPFCFVAVAALAWALEKAQAPAKMGLILLGLL